ncbi:PQQ-like beta-propeller repeat protein [Haloferula rosea]|uniref:PQQ-binding-like beta-propeller repeat protein n=1 Tax=Haloferula rosea TaxID=490093 RepID=A0A934RAV0_9BACT|nr:PQQ-like beta-propeller repeat protein [Haloferula rosea]MBK1826378.1 PQQ-binding-like beta-propeller repeat protein [Haloferula rosea]
MKLIQQVGLALGLGFVASAGEWREFHGPLGNGVAESDGPSSWTAKEGVAWKVAVPGSGWSTPVFADGQLVLTSATKEGSNTHLEVMAFRPEDGKLLWRTVALKPTEAEVAAIHPKNSLASPTALLADGRVYAHFGHMGTAALDAKTGKVLWTRKISYKPKHGGACTPIRVNDLLVFSADGEEKPTLVALKADSGEIAWRVERNVEVTNKFSFATPVAAEVDGSMQIISSASNMVGGYDPADGRLIWRVDFNGFSVTPKPVVSKGRVFVSTGFMTPNLLKIRLEGAKGDVTQTHVEWEVEKQIPKIPSLVVDEGAIYSVDDTGRVICLDEGTGELKWRSKLPGNFSASPVLTKSGLLYAPSEDGVFFVMKVSPEGGELVEQIEMGDRLFASPVVIDGAIYQRSEGFLWKITGK